MNGDGHIIPLEEKHWPDVAHIFESGLKSGISSLETSIPGWEKWDTTHLKECRFVMQLGDKTIGWVAIAPVSKRNCYEGVAESSIYFLPEFQGKGLASKLMHHLISESEKAGFWTLQAHILRENAHSIRFHEKAGFEFLCIRKKLGHRDGIWHDIVLMERRSALIKFT